MIEDTGPSRRELLTMIGKAGGAIAMYQAMTALGHAAETQFTGPPALTGASKVAQIDDCVGALKNTKFTADELARIDRHAKDGGLNLWAASSAG